MRVVARGGFLYSLKVRAEEEEEEPTCPEQERGVRLCYVKSGQISWSKAESQ